MKNKRLFSLLFFVVLLFISSSLSAKPILSKPKYLIATYDGYGAGLVVPNAGASHQLIYDLQKDVESAEENDYWIIKNSEGNRYTFQNAESGKYIRYDQSITTQRQALVLVDELYEDNSTSFILGHYERDGNSYYTIIPVVNESLSWNKRNALSDGVYPVGVYGLSTSGNSLFVFYDNEGDAVEDDGKVLPNFQLKRSLGKFEPYLTSFTINGKTPAPDTQKSRYYTTLSDNSLPASSVTLTIDFDMKNSAHTLAIDGMTVQKGVPFTLSNVSSNKKYILEILNGIQTVAVADLYFTSLPIVQITTENSIGDINVIAQMSVSEADKEGDADLLLTKIKIRGATSRGYPKKSYAINFRDESGIEKGNYTFFGLRNDNKWILDAMFVDPSRMRNRVSTDLWNDFATLPYWAESEEKMVNGTRGHYVEVFMNDAYHGLYCMTERVDRKQLKLKEVQVEEDEISNTINYTQRGALYKAKGWSTAVMFGYPYGGSSYIPSYNNNYLTWQTFEVKYPNDGEPILWDNLYAAITMSSEYYTNNNQTFLNSMRDVFDLPVYLDYYLFIELMLASDNHGKNTYVSIYNQKKSPKVTITPWDLDGTWGRRWDGNKYLTYAEQDFESFLRSHEHGTFFLFDRMKKLNADEWSSKKLKERYLELRQSHFSSENIINRFTDYANEFQKSGAWNREESRWGNLSLDSEISFLEEWTQTRLDYLDIQYLGKHITSTNTLNVSFVCTPNPVVDRFVVSALKPGAVVSIYNTQGQLLQQVKAQSDFVEIDMGGYSAGIYIVKTKEGATKILKN